MTRTGTIVTIVILAVLAFVAWEWRNSPIFNRLVGNTTQGQLVASATFQCNLGKTIKASFYQGPDIATQPGQMPQPNGSVTLALSDGRNLSLKQTISADGARYSDGDPQKQQGQSGAETFVFWNKGNGALVLENNQEKSYIGCIKVVDDPGNLPQVYENGQQGFSLRYPQGYTVDEKYVYNVGEQPIHGVKFAIDPAIATGTNLSSDSYISVEEIATATSSAQAPSCTADRFLLLPNGGAPTTLSDGTNTYSYASSTDAAAGNRYEEQVFAIPGTNPCVAVRYMIHWGVYENYPPGAVTEFNHDQLVAQFDAIRRTLTLNQ